MTPLDLNLLSIFDALYDLRSVTRTARRLNLTQSAVSHALRRLRLAVGDPLFLRSGGTLQPTTRAHDMAPGVREGLLRLRAAIVPALFDPTNAVRIFRIAAGPYFCALLVPDLVARVRALAPGVTIRVVPVGDDLVAMLDDGSVDLALGAFDRVPARLHLHPLFHEDLVWIAARDHPVAATATDPAALIACSRLVIATKRAFEPTRALIDGGTLASHTVQAALSAGDGDGPATVYDATTAAAIVARTDMIALVPRRLAVGAATHMGIRVLDTGDTGSGIDLAMLSHGKASADAGLGWLRDLIADLSA